MVFKPKKKTDKPVKEDLKKLSVEELKKKVAEDAALLKSLQEDTEEIDDELEEETVEEAEEIEEEATEEQKEEIDNPEEEIIKKQVNLTPGELVAAIEFNITQASNLLQLLK